MSNGIATKLALAALVWFAGCISQAVAQGPFETRYRVDPARHRVWLLTREGVFLYDASRPHGIAVTLPAWHWAGTPYGCLPDLALGPQGEAVVTSDVLPTLWRIAPDTLAVSVHPLALETDTDKDVGFSGIAYSSEHGAFFGVSCIDGSRWKIDRSLARARKIGLSGPAHMREAPCADWQANLR